MLRLLKRKEKEGSSLKQSLLDSYVEEKHALPQPPKSSQTGIMHPLMPAEDLLGLDLLSTEVSAIEAPAPTGLATTFDVLDLGDQPLIPAQDLLGLDLLREAVSEIEASTPTKPDTTFDILGLGDQQAIVEEKKDEELDVLAYFVNDKEASTTAQLVSPKQGVQLSNVGLFSPRQMSSASPVVENNISDKEALDHAASIALNLVNFYKEKVLSESDCKNIFLECALPVDLRRATRLQALLEFAGANDELTSKYIIEMIKTGKVDGIKGASNFGTLDLRGLFINKFIPSYGNFSHKDQWLRAANIRQGTHIDNFGIAALIEVAKVDKRNTDAHKPAQHVMR